MHESWRAALADQRALLVNIEGRLASLANAGDIIAPHSSKIMRAFQDDLAATRVLIVGQDPYPTDGHACGLSFAVEPGVAPLPKSLQNIMRELHDDLPGTSAGADLTKWQAQGVMLLNRHLTTTVGQAGAHSRLGWSAFTDAAIAALVSRGTPLVAILWGAHAQELKPALRGATIIESAHPSPLSAYRGFFGSKPFSRTNDALKNGGLADIDWSC